MVEYGKKHERGCSVVRKVFLIGFVLILMVGFVGCGDSGEGNPLIGNTYRASQPTGIDRGRQVPDGQMGFIMFSFVRFHENGTLEWVDVVWDGVFGSNATYRNNKHYGSYDLDGGALTITLSGEDSMLLVVHEGGAELTYGSTRFRVFDESTSDEQSRSALDQFR